MTYTKTTWENDTTPAINATNLNKMETGIDEAHDAIENTSTGHNHDGVDSKQVDHGALTGIADDDHTQYLLADGSRPMSGDLLPDGSANRDFGSSTSPWRDAHIDGVIYMQQSNGSDIYGCHDLISPAGITMGIDSEGDTLDLECGTGGYVRLGQHWMAPLWDNDHDLGQVDHRWKNIYGMNGIFNTLSFEKLSLGSPTELTISGGVVTATKSYHKIDTEADAATDDLDTINGGVEGDILIISPMSYDRTIVVKNDAFNGIYLSGSDFTMDSDNDILTLLCMAPNTWTEISRSDNGV